MSGPSKMMKCRSCGQPAAWVSPNYFNKGSVAHKEFGTRDYLLCEEHGKEAAELNPFVGWRRLAAITEGEK